MYQIKLLPLLFLNLNKYEINNLELSVDSDIHLKSFFDSCIMLLNLNTIHFDSLVTTFRLADFNPISITNKNKP